ncbi:hypothetical protein K7432_016690 [Basidiobolus ranarum]|uniref:Uncharacterized protein n=1 Tax=Basidiobolus ranarum TaxID=34480 RepID=A0ABR2WEB6_9FUNG
MSSVSWLKISFPSRETGEKLGFHVQFLSASKVMCVHCRQNMVVGPQSFKVLRCTSCGIQFFTPLHSSCSKNPDSTITADFKFDRPVDLGTFLHNHGTGLSSSSARIGFVYFREKSGPSSLLNRSTKKIRNDLRFLGSIWEKALAIVSGSWIRFYDLQSETSLDAQYKLIGELELKDIQLDFLTEYKGRRCVLALSRGRSYVYIQVGSSTLQYWWGECFEYFVQKLRPPRHYNSSSSLNCRTYQTNVTSPLSRPPHTGGLPKSFFELERVKHLKKRLSSFHIGGLELISSLGNSEQRYSSNIYSTDFVQETTDADDLLSSSPDSSTVEGFSSSEGDEEPHDCNGRWSHNLTESKPDSLQMESNWEYLLDAFPLPPI